MRVGSDRDPLSGWIVGRARVIEKAPGAHHAAMAVWQRAPDLETVSDDSSLRFESFHGHGFMMRRVAGTDNRR